MLVHLKVVVLASESAFASDRCCVDERHGCHDPSVWGAG